MFWWLTCALCHHEIWLLMWDIKFCYSYWTGWNTSWSGFPFPKVPLQLTFNSSSTHFLKSWQVTAKQSRDLEEGIKGQHWHKTARLVMRRSSSWEKWECFGLFHFRTVWPAQASAKAFFGRCQTKLWLLLLPLSKKEKQNMRIKFLLLSFSILFPLCFCIKLLFLTTFSAHNNIFIVSSPSFLFLPHTLFSLSLIPPVSLVPQESC